MNAIESYTWFGREVVEITDEKISLGVLKTVPTSQMIRTIKIITMILTLGILPLLALAIKCISRCLKARVTYVVETRPAHEVVAQNSLLKRNFTLMGILIEDAKAIAVAELAGESLPEVDGDALDELRTTLQLIEELPECSPALNHEALQVGFKNAEKMKAYARLYPNFTEIFNEILFDDSL